MSDHSGFGGRILPGLLASPLPTTNAQALPQPPWPLLCPQGTYALQDNSFPLLVRMASGLQYLEEAPKVWGC